ncbi:MAG: dCMP deaminase family protein [Neisseriaceae bacterium]|nr:MAG: dCMP deaminase family protein [Neisseriaceae bacterium]
MEYQQKWDQRLLDMAQFVSGWSKDPSTQVGAVIVDEDNRIVSVGYNGFAKKVKDCKNRLNNRDIKYKMIVHGEINAILFANKSTKGCTLYTYPFMPCSNCAPIIINSGIKRVVSYLDNNPRWTESFKLSTEQFSEAEVELILVERKKS